MIEINNFERFSETGNPSSDQNYLMGRQSWILAVDLLQVLIHLLAIAAPEVLDVFS
jgi:hypothetical protein